MIDAVVEGIGDVLTNPPNVNLSPILSAVASVLRGPIRNAIANRRKEVVSRKSDQVMGFGLFYIFLQIKENAKRKNLACNKKKTLAALASSTATTKENAENHNITCNH